MNSTDEDQLLRDATRIGKPMLAEIKKLAAERNIPLCDLYDALLGSFMAISGIVLEDDPKLKALRS